MIKDPAFIILAAGKGTRLGGAIPKPLTQLPDGRTIIQQQLDNIEAVYGARALSRVRVVVGHRAEELVEQLPQQVSAVYNADYDRCNTAWSLYRGLQQCPVNRPIIWMNGDVVFSPLILGRANDLASENFMAVVPGPCGEEEMKYSLTAEGLISSVSKENKRGLGEAVGINQISAKDRMNFMLALKKQHAQAYFEAAIQETLRHQMNWFPLDTSGLHAVEVDFVEDLEKVNQLYQVI